MTVKFIFNNHKDCLKIIHEQWQEQSLISIMKLNFQFQTFSFSNYCQRGKLAGKFMRHSREFLLDENSWVLVHVSIWLSSRMTKFNDEKWSREYVSNYTFWIFINSIFYENLIFRTPNKKSHPNRLETQKRQIIFSV